MKDKNIEKVSIKGEVKTSSEETDPFSDLTYKAETEISFELKSVNDLPKLLSFADYEKIEIVEKED